MKQAFRYSLKSCMPIMISFIPVGLAYGVHMRASGLNRVWTGACGLFISAALTAGLRLRKRSTMLSIAGGTICCMVLTQLVF